MRFAANSDAARAVKSKGETGLPLKRRTSAAKEVAEKCQFRVIPNEVRNPSCAIAEQKERFLVASLLGMTPFLLFSAACKAVSISSCYGTVETVP